MNLLAVSIAALIEPKAPQYRRRVAILKFCEALANTVGITIGCDAGGFEADVRRIERAEEKRRRGPCLRLRQADETTAELAYAARQVTP